MARAVARCRSRRRRHAIPAIRPPAPGSCNDRSLVKSLLSSLVGTSEPATCSRRSSATTADRCPMQPSPSPGFRSARCSGVKQWRPPGTSWPRCTPCSSPILCPSPTVRRSGWRAGHWRGWRFWRTGSARARAGFRTLRPSVTLEPTSPRSLVLAPPQLCAWPGSRPHGRLPRLATAPLPGRAISRRPPNAGQNQFSCPQAHSSRLSRT